MKKETFEKAQELNIKITDLEQAIDKIENPPKGCGNYPALNFTFCFDEEFDSLKRSNINYLKNRLKSFRKEFANLK